MKIKTGRLFGFIIVICVLIFGTAFASKYAGLSDYRKEIESLNTQIDEQEKYGKELDKTAREYTSDAYVEKYARGLGLVKPNEKIFRNYSEKR